MQMPKRSHSSTDTFVDPDDAPELTEEWFQEADVYEGAKLIRRGRPPSDNAKKLVSLRLSPEVLDHFKAAGPAGRRGSTCGRKVGSPYAQRAGNAGRRVGRCRQVRG